MPERWWLRVGAFGLVYLGLGLTSALVANPLPPGLGQASIRVVIFFVAIAVFYSHAGVEVARQPASPRMSALRTAAAVSCGTLLLAVYAVSMAWLESAHVSTSLRAALIVWPVATGAAAFLAALILGRLREWARRRAGSG